jgi:hypothetical protein
MGQPAALNARRRWHWEGARSTAAPRRSRCAFPCRRRRPRRAVRAHATASGNRTSRARTARARPLRTGQSTRMQVAQRSALIHMDVAALAPSARRPRACTLGKGRARMPRQPIRPGRGTAHSLDRTHRVAHMAACIQLQGSHLLARAARRLGCRDQRLEGHRSPPFGPVDGLRPDEPATHAAALSAPHCYSFSVSVGVRGERWKLGGSVCRCGSYFCVQ